MSKQKKISQMTQINGQYTSDQVTALREFVGDKSKKPFLGLAKSAFETYLRECNPVTLKEVCDYYGITNTGSRQFVIERLTQAYEKNELTKHSKQIAGENQDPFNLVDDKKRMEKIKKYL